MQAAMSRFGSTDGAVPSQNGVHVLPSGECEHVELERLESDVSAPKRCATTWRETSRATPLSVPACICHLQEHSTLNTELFMPALTLEPGSGFHCHTDGWDSRGREKIAATYPNTVTTLREIDATDVEFMLSRERKTSSGVWIFNLTIQQAKFI